MAYRISKFYHALNKYDRAVYHIGSLKAALHRYANEGGLKLIVDFDKSTGQNQLSFGVDPMPIEVLLIVGDAIHNLSSALDCLSSWLIADKTGNWNKRIYFPTHETLADLARSFESHGDRPCSCGNGVVTRKGSNAIIREYAPEFETLLLNTFKPCKDQNSVIWAIRKLDNINKHNAVLMGIGSVTAKSIDFGTKENSLFIGNTLHIPAGSRIPVGHSKHPFHIFSKGTLIANLVFDPNLPIPSYEVVPWLERAAEVVGDAVLQMEERFGTLIEVANPAN